MNEAFNDGYMSYEEGMDRNCNPYDRGEDDWLEWDSGWAYGREMESSVGGRKFPKDSEYD